MLSRSTHITRVMLLLAAFCAWAMPARIVFAGTTAVQAPATAPTRVVGAVTAASNGLLTVKSDAGVTMTVKVPDGIKMQRVAPGAHDLSSATAIQFTDVAVGDRVLIRLAPDSTADSLNAASLIAITQQDLAQKQQQERMDWARRGVGGLVKSVDASAGVIVVTSGAGPTQKTLTISTTASTVMKRYAADSVDYNKASAGPITAIQPGDQLRARGEKNADGTQIAAQEVVSGSFRNIAGVLTAVNVEAGTLTLKDLATKQNVTVHLTDATVMRKLPEGIASMLSNMTHAGGGEGMARTAATAQTPGASSTAMAPRGGGPGGTPGGAGNGARWGGAGAGNGMGGGGGSDPQSMISRAPAIRLADLKKGEAVMLVSTAGKDDVTAINLLAGVEPLLQATAATQNMLMSGWNMSSGSAETGAQQ